ncbi:MAG: MBL fold metallo-hydrolase [Marmoricola sp.]|nr:MBL fold metallo-hydrolase [Marmoricola sp.]
MRLAWLGHATVVLDVAGTQVLTDPLLRRNNGPLRRRGPQPRREQWKDCDVVLISHLHHDHVELGSLRMLPDLPLVTTPANAQYLRRRRLRGIGLWHDEWYDVGHVSVRLTRADHHSRPMPHRPNEACGHLVRSRDTCVWIAGDTSMYPELADLPELAGGPIDLAVVPIHGWGPRLSGGHLDSETAAEACAMVGAAAAMPYHWGSLHAPGMQQRPPGWMDRPGPAFVEALARKAPHCRPLVLAPGESAEVAA